MLNILKEIFLVPEIHLRTFFFLTTPIKRYQSFSILIEYAFSILETLLEHRVKYIQHNSSFKNISQILG